MHSLQQSIATVCYIFGNAVPEIHAYRPEPHTQHNEK